MVGPTRQVVCVMQQCLHNAHPNATAVPPISLPFATAVPHRPLVRAFGRRAIEPVGSLSGLSGAAAGFGGIGDDPGPVVAFANGAFDLSGTNEAPSPVASEGETSDVYG